MLRLFLMATGIAVLAGCATTGGPETTAPETDALGAVNAALLQHPDDSRLHYRRGNLLFDAARYEEAVEAYGKATALDPAHADAYTNLGLSLRRVGRYGEAIDAYETALQLVPDDLVTLRNLKALAESIGEVQRTAWCIRRLAALQPQDPQAQSAMAALLLEEENYEEAAEIYEALLLHGPPTADLLYNLGLCYYSLGRYPEAESAWQQAVDREVRHASANRGLAVLYWVTEDYTRAWDAVRRCQRLDIGLDPAFLESLRRDSGKRASL